MKPSKQEYQAMVREASPNSPLWKDLILAFLVGGTICALGQLLQFWWEKILPADQAPMAVSVSLVALSALLTGFSVYDDLARFAGAGTLVPITGFANAVVSAAMEYRTEGLIPGVGAKMFTICGPVIVYGTAASVVYGGIYWALTR